MSFCPWESYNDSEVLAAGRYDLDISRLELQFRDGKTYEYYDVPVTVWQAFSAAPSKGGFFNSRISSNYPSRPVGHGGGRQQASSQQESLSRSAPPLPNHSSRDVAQSYFDEAMRLVKESPNDPHTLIKGTALLRKAAEMNHFESQELLFLILSKNKATVNEARMWWERSNRTKQGLPNSPATDWKPGVMDGGCVSLLVVGLFLLGGVAYLV
jgi:hypothetical protein